MVLRQDGEDPPIPTYEEATVGQNFSQDLPDLEQYGEQHGLLSGQTGEENARSTNYRRPTVRSVRSSMDSDMVLSELSSRGSADRLQRDFEELEVEDPMRDMGEETIISRIWKRIGRYVPRISHSTGCIEGFRLPSFSRLLSLLPASSKTTGLHMVRFFALLLVLAFLYLVFVSDISPMGKRPYRGPNIDPEEVKSWVQGELSEQMIETYLKKLSSFDHLAGTEGDFFHAKWVESHFKDAGFDTVEINEYQVYMNYAKAGGREVSIQSSAARGWKALLEEGNGYPDESSTGQQKTFAYHAHSKSGNATGPLVYANFGSKADFLFLEGSGIDLKGKIVLMRSAIDASSLAAPVANAEKLGAIGCLFYSDADPSRSRRTQIWPDDVVQRYSVSSANKVLGDVLTPGWASTGEAKRISKDGNPALPTIPSLSLGWRDARVLILALEGHGVKVPDQWVGGISGIRHWKTGDNGSPLVNLRNEQDEYEKQKIWNVVGSITGVEQPEKKIIVGSPRDAWCLGAAGPGSGSAIMLEIVRVLGELRKLQWRPLRTIEFASWDGSAPNFIGSTEFTEENIQDLRANGMAYINVGAGVTGGQFRAAASPALNSALLHALGRTSDPVKNETLKDIWLRGTQLEHLSASGDYAPFQFIAGMSSIDLSFSGPDTPVGSCYDTLSWVQKYNDPLFKYHRTLAEVWALVILELADSYLMPFSMKSYAEVINQAVEGLQILSLKAQAASRLSRALDLKSLIEAASLFSKNSEIFDNWDQDWTTELYASAGFESTQLAIRRQSHNSRMANFEAHVLDLAEGGGLPGREQYKHLLQGPSLKSPDAPTFFPSIIDAINAGDWKTAQKEVQKVADILSKASKKLLN